MKSALVRTSQSKKRLLSITEIKEEYGVTDWFWRTQIWNGKLPTVKVGRKQLVDRTDIDLFIEKHKQVELVA